MADPAMEGRGRVDCPDWHSGYILRVCLQASLFSEFGVTLEYLDIKCEDENAGSGYGALKDVFVKCDPGRAAWRLAVTSQVGAAHPIRTTYGEHSHFDCMPELPTLA